MALKIYVSGAASITIRIDRATRIEVDASGEVRIDVGDGRDGPSIPIGARGRDRAGRGPRRLPPPNAVTPAMEAAAVAAFLAGADVERLGRSLADVYRAMEEARRVRQGFDDEG